MARNPVKPTIKREVGRPPNYTRALEAWAVEVVLDVQRQQIAKNQVASGSSLESWQVTIKKPDLVEISAADYYAFLVKENTPPGRGPTRRSGPGAVWRAIMRWLPQKGIRPPTGMTLSSLAYVISRSIHKSGTHLYQTGTVYGDGEPMSLEKAIENSFDETMDEAAQAIAEEAADRLVRAFQKDENFKVIDK